MPKKDCCCDGHWVAVPCRYYGKIVFVGYNDGFEGFSESSSLSQVQAYFESNDSPFGPTGPYEGMHPFWPFPSQPGLGINEGTPPSKLVGITCTPEQMMNWGGYGGAECIVYEAQLDTTRQVLYKAWGAGGGGKNSSVYGGNGAYSQYETSYNPQFIACVGMGGFGDSVGGFPGTYTPFLSAGGGRGFDAWGGGGAYVSTVLNDASGAPLIAGGGAGAGDDASSGGHGGASYGSDASGTPGGKGANGAVGGSGGVPDGQDGSGTIGGNGGSQGGGGGGGYGGGGGGGSTGYGGGGASSRGNSWYRSASDLGPPNICDPDFWLSMPMGVDSIPAIGGFMAFPVSNNTWNPSNTRTDGSGLSGKIVASFASLRCPCDSSKDTIPEKSYICLSNAQAEYICETITNCCDGVAGSVNTCTEGLVPGTTLDTRASGADVGRGTTASAGAIGPGGGSGGIGLGGIYCENLGGITFGAGSPTRSGESESVRYRSFMYDGELYYLVGQCGVLCDDDHLIPNDADITEIQCREWAACCDVIYGVPLCRVNGGGSDADCWTADPCPCNPPIEPTPLPFIVCDNIDDYPDDTFWTQVGQWYYTAWKTTFWEPFGDSTVRKLGGISILTTEPDCTETTDGLGSLGESETPNCCQDITESWSGQSPWSANITTNIEYTGKGPLVVGGCFQVCDCTCCYDFTDTHYTDSISVDVQEDGGFWTPCTGTRYTFSGSKSSGECANPITTPCTGSTFAGEQTWEYALYSPGNFGSGLVEGCYYNVLSCSGNTYIQKFGYPVSDSDLAVAGVLSDACFKIVTQCVVESPDCAPSGGGCGSPPPMIFGGSELCSDNTCDGYGPSETGKTILTNGCRLQTLINALVALGANSGKFSVVDLGRAEGYWIGGPRSDAMGIPGDSLSNIDFVTSYDTIGDTTTQTCEWTYYFSSPAFGVEFSFVGKPLSRCCGSHPSIRFVQSSCGRYDSSTIPDFVVVCGGTPPECMEQHPPVVRTYKTLAQWETSSSVTMIPDDSYDNISYCTQPCPSTFDDFDGSQTCSISVS